MSYMTNNEHRCIAHEVAITSRQSVLNTYTPYDIIKDAFWIIMRVVLLLVVRPIRYARQLKQVYWLNGGLGDMPDHI